MTAKHTVSTPPERNEKASEKAPASKPASTPSLKPDTPPAAGPHASPKLTDPEKTPGAGSLPDPQRPHEGDATTG
ncbi:MAG: hypothetical protein H2042_13050 [Rhizobiales bacterium]|nr:hypothetical protein [Hyphomicrobiales bacterium]